MPNEVTGAFEDLPISQLIGAPLTAACEAQLQLSAAAFDYMTKIGFKEGDPSKGANLIEFDLQRPVDTGSGIEVNDVHVAAPFLGLVPIPSLLIDDVSIDFQMEVSATSQTRAKTEAEVAAKASGRFWGVSFEVSGRVTSSRENTRSTNQTAKYQINVHARQQPPTEGLNKLMDVMASCVDPIRVTSSGGGGEGG